MKISANRIALYHKRYKVSESDTDKDKVLNPSKSLVEICYKMYKKEVDCMQ